MRDHRLIDSFYYLYQNYLEFHFDQHYLKDLVDGIVVVVVEFAVDKVVVIVVVQVQISAHNRVAVEVVDPVVGVVGLAVVVEIGAGAVSSVFGVDVFRQVGLDGRNHASLVFY